MKEAQLSEVRQMTELRALLEGHLPDGRALDRFVPADAGDLASSVG